jgi:hypothetical protein
LAIDIEASISERHLGIGVFGSQQQISHDRAVLLACSIADLLKEVTA